MKKENDPLINKTTQYIRDLERLQKPERFKELISMIHLYCEYFMDRILKKQFGIDQEDFIFQEQILDNICFNKKIGILGYICKFYGLEKHEKTKILLKNLCELNGNRNRIAHNIDVETLKFSKGERKIDDKCIDMIMENYGQLISEIHRIEVSI